MEDSDEVKVGQLEAALSDLTEEGSETDAEELALELNWTVDEVYRVMGLLGERT